MHHVDDGVKGMLEQKYMGSLVSTWPSCFGIKGPSIRYRHQRDDLSPRARMVLHWDLFCKGSKWDFKGKRKGEPQEHTANVSTSALPKAEA